MHTAQICRAHNEKRVLKNFARQWFSLSEPASHRRSSCIKKRVTRQAAASHRPHYSLFSSSPTPAPASSFITKPLPYFVASSSSSDSSSTSSRASLTSSSPAQTYAVKDKDEILKGLMAKTSELCQQNIADAKAFFEEWKDRADVNGWDLMLNAFAARSDVKSIEAYYAEMQKSGVTPSYHTFVSMIRCYLKTGQQEKMLPLFDDMIKYGRNPTKRMMSIMMRIAKDTGNVQRMELYYQHLLTRHKDIPVTAKIFNMMMHMYSKLGLTEKVEEVQKEMKRRGIRSNVHLLTTLISTYAGSSDLDGMSRCMQEILELQLEMNAHLTSAVMAAMGRFGNVDGVSKLFKEMTDSGIRPNLYHYIVMIHTFARSGYPDKAFEYFRQLKASGLEPNLLAYNALLEAFTRSGQVERTMELFRELKSRFRPDITSYNSLLLLFVQQREYQAVLNVYDEMMAEGVPLNIKSYGPILRSLSRLGNYQRLIAEWHRFCRDPLFEPHVGNYHIVMKLLAKRGRIDALAALYADMIRRKIEPDIFIYDALIGGAARHGEVHRMMGYLNDMQRRGVKPNDCIYTSIMVGFAREGLMNKMQHVLEEAKSRGMACTGQYNTMLYSLAKHGDYQRISKVLEQMIADRIPADSVTLTHVVAARPPQGFQGQMLKLVRYLFVTLQLRPCHPPFFEDLPELQEEVLSAAQPQPQPPPSELSSAAAR